MAYKSFYTGSGSSAVAANKNHAALWNPSASTVLVLHVQAWAALAGAVTGGSISLTLYELVRTVANTGAPVGGTPLSIQTAAEADAAAISALGLVVVTAPTALTGLTVGTVPLGGGVLTTEETAVPSPPVDLYAFRTETGARPIELGPFQGLLMQQGGFSPAGGSIGFSIHCMVA